MKTFWFVSRLVLMMLIIGVLTANNYFALTTGNLLNVAVMAQSWWVPIAWLNMLFPTR